MDIFDNSIKSTSRTFTMSSSSRLWSGNFLEPNSSNCYSFLFIECLLLSCSDAIFIDGGLKLLWVGGTPYPSHHISQITCIILSLSHISNLCYQCAGFQLKWKFSVFNCWATAHNLVSRRKIIFNGLGYQHSEGKFIVCGGNWEYCSIVHL